MNTAPIYRPESDWIIPFQIIVCTWTVRILFKQSSSLISSIYKFRVTYIHPSNFSFWNLMFIFLRSDWIVDLTTHLRPLVIGSWIWQLTSVHWWLDRRAVNSPHSTGDWLVELTTHLSPLVIGSWSWQLTSVHWWLARGADNSPQSTGDWLVELTTHLSPLVTSSWRWQLTSVHCRGKKWHNITVNRISLCGFVTNYLRRRKISPLSLSLTNVYAFLMVLIINSRVST
jgi:hypothetical protein